MTTPRTTPLASRSGKGLLTLHRCVVTLIDLQPPMLLGVSGADRQAIVTNNTTLAKAAGVFDAHAVMHGAPASRLAPYVAAGHAA